MNRTKDIPQLTGTPTIITDFNIEILHVNTPLRSEEETLKILMLINPVDTGTIYKILDGIIPFKPEDTYYTRLYNALVMGEIQP